MTSDRPARIHRTRRRVACLLLVGAALAAALGDRLPTTAPPSATASAPAPASAEAPIVVRDEPARPLGIDDGAVPDDTTAFADDIPGVTHLDPALRDALQRAALAAEDAGIELHVDSGWRSAAYQQHLLDEAVARYGSAREAARWVASPETSLHVAGEAVDVGPADAASWLAEHGAAYGLCRVYGNEPWHFELRAGGCPALLPDPTHDPRLWR